MWHRIRPFVHLDRWRIITVVVVVLAGGTAFMVPQFRAKASELKSIVLGSDTGAVTIVTDQGLADQLGERVNTLEAEVTALKEARSGDATLIKQLQADYQSAINEVAAAHDTFVSEAAQVEKSLGQVPAAQTATVTSKKISINQGTVAELDTLPGIGPAYAQRIVDYRNAHGPFKTIDNLDAVTGIGPATIEKIRDLVEL